MRMVKLFFVVFDLAFLDNCANNRQQPKLVPVVAVDPSRDVVIIPQDICPKFGGWIAKTQEAQILEENDLIDRDRDWRLKLSDAQGAQFIAESQRDQALEALEKSGWWNRWGLPLGIGIGAVITGVLSGVVIIMTK